MATIIPRKSDDGAVSYQVRVRLKGHPPTSATFSRLTDARKWAQQTENQIREGRYFKTSESRRHTVAEVVDRYIQDVLPGKKDRAAPKRQLEWWKREIGHLALSDVTPALVGEARDKLLREPVDWSGSKRKKTTQRTPGTVNRYLAAISHAFSIAVVEWEWLDANPLTRVRRFKESRGRVRFLDDDERERFLEKCRESQQLLLYPAVVLSLATGARQGEIMSLQWKDVDMKRELITFHETKNDERRSVPLTGLALDVLRDLRSNNATVFPWVFPGRGGRKPIDLRTPFLKALKAASIEDFRWHDLRHCTASYLAMNGATLAEIAAVLGHKQLDMVRRYAHLSPQHTAGVVSRMTEKIFGGK